MSGPGGAGDRFDAIVVGSGFGGSVVACRLAEAGRRVLVLERGRRWDPSTFPRSVEDPWLWDQFHPERENGWFDVRIFRRMAVAQGAGVGGGSLVYANISIEPDAALFDAGWPSEVTYTGLVPHLRTVGRMLAVGRVPEEQWPERTRLMRDAAVATGDGDRFMPLELAVAFDPAWRPDGPDARSQARSVPFVNGEGRRQGTCVQLGECDIGCPVNARNTLDLTYLARAERFGAEIRPLHLVRAISPDGGGYRLHASRIAGGRLVDTTASARRVIVAGGSLGSTELLLRSRDVARTLPRLPRSIGLGWSSNGDFLTLGDHPSRPVRPTVGPTITSAIDYRDGARYGRAFIIEDGGFPDVLASWVRASRRRFHLRRQRRLLTRILDPVLDAEEAAIEHLMPWFSQGRDAADGRLHLGRRWWLLGPWTLGLDWNPAASMPLLDAISATHRRLAIATGGTPHDIPTWAALRYLITPHPLGGCRMGSDPATSVVDHRGQVWDHPGLYVADGAILPRAIGANPSRTIAALAERISTHILAEER